MSMFQNRQSLKALFRCALVIVTLVGASLSSAGAEGKEKKPNAEKKEDSFPPKPKGTIEKTPQAINKFILALGHQDAQKRKQARAQLFWIGEPAKDALYKATKSKNNEIQEGANQVLWLLAVAGSLKPVNVRFMLRGYCYAGSAEEDRVPFDWSPNLPQKLTDNKKKMSKGKCTLVAEADVISKFAGKYRGLRLSLLNGTQEKLAFSAQDSRLYIIQEAKTTDDIWKHIEYLPSSRCGNSYHQVYLPPNHGWSFSAPRYVGNLKVKLRFKLCGGKKAVIYSNEFDGSINPEQFKIKQGHKPTSLMDPYRD